MSILSDTAPSLLVNTALKSTILLFGVWLSVHLFARKQPALHSQLLSQAAFVLLLLPIISFFIPALHLPILPPQSDAAPLANQVTEPHVQMDETLFDGEVLDMPSMSDSRRQNAEQAGRANQVLETHGFSWAEPVLSIYVFGFCIGLARLILGWWQVHILRQNIRHFGGPHHVVRLGFWCRRLGLTGNIDIGISDRVRVPTVIGMMKPLILIPESILSKTSDTDMDGIIVHELAHVKRRDAYWNVLAMVMVALYWFHPLAYWLRRNLADMREFACDDLAVSVLGDTEQYATTVLEVTAQADQRLSQALGLDMARTSRVLRRIDRLVNFDKQGVPYVSRVVSIVLLLVMVATTALLASLEPVSYSESYYTDQEIEGADEAVDWLRDRYFAYDYVAGTHIGRALTEKFPGQAELQAWYVLHLLERDKSTFAQDVVNKMPDALAWTNFAKAFAWEKIKDDEARVCSERAFQQMPNHSDFIWMRAKKMWRYQGSSDALAFIDRHLEKTKTPSQLFSLKGEILFSLYTKERSPIRSAGLEAVLTNFERARFADAQNISSYFLPGYFLLRLQRKSEAHFWLKQAAAMSPHSSRIHNAYWRAILGLNDYTVQERRDEIERDIERFLKPVRYAERWMDVGLVYEKMGLPLKAEAAMSHILDKFSSSPEAEWVSAHRYRKLREAVYMGDDDQNVKKAYLKSLWEFVDKPQHDNKKLLTDTYRDLFDVLRKDPKARPEDLLRVVRGLASHEIHNIGMAFYVGPLILAERTAYYREAESIVRQSALAIKKWEAHWRGRFGGNIKVAVNDHMARLHDALGWIYFLEGRYGNAEEELLTSYRLQPNALNTLYHLGRLNEQLGKWGSAEAFYVACMQKGKGYITKDLMKRLEIVYQNHQGHLQGVEDYLTRLKQDAEAYHKMQVLSLRKKQTVPVRAYDFKFIGDAPFSLFDLQGKVVLIQANRRKNLSQLKDLQDVSSRFDERDGVVIVYMSQESDLVGLQTLRNGKVYISRDSGFLGKMGIRRFPTTLLIDRQGQVAFEFVGARRKDIWLKETMWCIDKLVGEAELVN